MSAEDSGGGFIPLSFGDYDEAINAQDRRIPSGHYDIQVAKWEFVESNQKGTPGIYVELRVINAEDPQWNNWPLHHRAWYGGSNWGVKILVLGIGGPAVEGETLNPTEVREGPGNCDILDSFVGEEARVIVDEEEYQGQKQTRVKRFVLRKGGF